MTLLDHLMPRLARLATDGHFSLVDRGKRSSGLRAALTADRLRIGMGGSVLDASALLASFRTSRCSRDRRAAGGGLHSAVTSRKRSPSGPTAARGRCRAGLHAALDLDAPFDRAQAERAGFCASRPRARPLARRSSVPGLERALPGALRRPGLASSTSASPSKRRRHDARRPDHRLRRRRADRGADAGQHAQGAGARQRPADQRLDRLGARRDRGGARCRRHVRGAHPRHDGRRRRAQPARDGRVRDRARAGSDRAAGASSACRSTRDGDGDLHLTREGGHSHRRIVHVADATGWAVQAALLKAAEANPNITLLPDRSCIDLITGRHEERYSGSGRVWGAYALDTATGKVEAHVARATILAAGRRGARLPVLDRPARRDRRRHRHGLARRLPRLQHGDDAVPPDLPLQPRGQELPDHRGGARRGRAAQASRRTGHRFMPRLRRAGGARAARHRGARDRRPRSSASASTTSTSTSATCRPSS